MVMNNLISIIEKVVKLILNFCYKNIFIWNLFILLVSHTSCDIIWSNTYIYNVWQLRRFKYWLINFQIKICIRIFSSSISNIFVIFKYFSETNSRLLFQLILKGIFTQYYKFWKSAAQISFQKIEPDRKIINKNVSCINYQTSPFFKYLYKSKILTYAFQHVSWIWLIWFYINMSTT